MTALKAIPGVSKLAPYAQGQSHIKGVANPIKLSSNESSHGPCAAALEAYRKAGEQLNRYPDGSQFKLRQAIAGTFGYDLDRIICGNGSDELIQMMVRAYVAPGDEALLSENSFIMSNIHCTAQGAELVITPERDYRVDVDAMLERVTKKTRFCTIANPNNPTGTYISGDEIRRLHAGLPGNCLLLLDNAYAEYVTAENYNDGAVLVNEFDNVVTTRTFSKIYGLPSLRIGWAYCPRSVVDTVQRIRTPFNTNGPALAAATAAVQDSAYVAKIREYNARWLRRIQTAVTDMGITMVPSVANFYLLCFVNAGDKSGTGAEAFLQSRGIISRPAGDSDDFLRITVGLDHENEVVLAALKDYMGT